MAIRVLAHGVGGRSDLPVPEWQAAWGAALVMVLSFAALGLLWRRPRLGSLAMGRRLNGAAETLLRAAGGMGRLVALLLFVVVLVAGLFGSHDTVSNIAPVSVYVIFWVGVPVVSVILGPVWRAVSPWETLGRLVGGLRSGEAPGWLANGWAALVPISLFHWLELAYHEGASPRVIGWWGLLYTAGLMVFARRWGWEEARKAEGFGVLFDALASLSPFCRDGSGRLSMRPPLVGVADLETPPALVAVVLVALGGTALGGVGQTHARSALRTAGLLLAVLAVFLASRPWMGPSPAATTADVEMALNAHVPAPPGREIMRWTPSHPGPYAPGPAGGDLPLLALGAAAAIAGARRP